MLGKTEVPFGKLDMDVLREQERIQRPSYIPPNMNSEILSSRVGLRTPVTVTTLSAGLHPRFVRIVRHFKGWAQENLWVEAKIVHKRTYPTITLRLSRRCCFVSYNAITTLTSLMLDVFYGKRRLTWKVFRCSRRCGAVRLLTAYLILTVDDRKPVVQIRHTSNVNKEEKCCAERVRNVRQRFGAFTLLTRRFCTILYFVKVCV